MQNITKVSDMTVDDLVDYLRLSEPDESELNTLGVFLSAAKSYIAGYTGRTAEEIDAVYDFVIAVFVLCQDMWDNRTLYIDLKNGGKVNRTVESILNMHAGNLL